MDVLAVVSKAVFEKQARVAGKRVEPGEVWPTALYASTNPGLESLAAGGSLFLVTVRPGDRLWLAGILEKPTKNDEGWTAKPNAVPVRDVTGLIPKLRFASGKGLSAEPGKLGMSLQTPRVLATDDVAALRGGGAAPSAPATPQAAYASVLAATSEMQAATAYAQSTLASAKAGGPAGLRLENYRRRTSWSVLTTEEKRLLDRFEGDIEQADEFEGGELMDVVDEVTGKVTHLFALWPFGSGVVVDAATGDDLADVVQHYFDAHNDQDLRTRLAAAYAAARPTLGIRESVDFRPGRDSKKRGVRVPADESTLADIRAMRARAAQGDETLRQPPGQTQLWEMAARVFDFEAFRPLPARRLYDLSETEREMLQLIVDASEAPSELWRFGLPDNNGHFYRRSNPKIDEGPLARWLGRIPPGALDETVDVEGRPHPVWCLLHDAIHGVREMDSVLAIVKGLPVARRVAITRGVMEDVSQRLRQVIPNDLKEARKEMISDATRRPQIERREQMIVRLFDDLGVEGQALAKALVDERADWASKHGPSLEKNPHLITPDWECLCTALGVMARGARRRGEVLDPAYDETLRVLGLPYYAIDAVGAILAELPPERAGRLGCRQLELIRRFPSNAGAAALAGLLPRVQGPYMDKLFLDVVKALGERARGALEEARQSHPDRKSIVDKALVVLEKKTAKKGTKSAKPN